MTQKRDVKELIEVLDGIEAVGVPVAETLADGKVNAEDFPHALELLQGHQKIIDAVEGIDEIPAEVADIDPAEAVLVVQKLYSVVGKIKEAAKKPEVA
jgi:hypothetical protein